LGAVKWRSASERANSYVVARRLGRSPVRPESAPGKIARIGIIDDSSSRERPAVARIELCRRSKSRVSVSPNGNPDQWRSPQRRLRKRL